MLLPKFFKEESEVKWYQKTYQDLYPGKGKPERKLYPF